MVSGTGAVLISAEEIETALAQRQQARQEKDFARADALKIC